MAPGPLFYTLIHWLVSAVALTITAYVVPGFKVRNFTSALITAVVIGLASITVGRLLVFLTLPITILTFGLFLFVIDAIILKICSGILKDFEITNWFSAFIGAFVLTVVGSALHFFII